MERAGASEEILASLTAAQSLLLAQMQSILPDTPGAALISAVRKTLCLNDALSWVLEQTPCLNDQHGCARCPAVQGGVQQQHQRTKKRGCFAPHVLLCLDTSQHTVMSSLLRSKLRLFLGSADRGRLGAAAPTWYEVAWGENGRKRQGIKRTHLEQLDRKLFFASGGGCDALNLPLMRVLVSWNASPCGFRGECGVTALHYAALKDDNAGSACACLLEAGASATAVDLAGRTPRDWARHERIKTLLVENEKQSVQQRQAQSVAHDSE